MAGKDKTAKKGEANPANKMKDIKGRQRSQCVQGWGCMRKDLGEKELASDCYH